MLNSFIRALSHATHMNGVQKRVLGLVLSCEMAGTDPKHEMSRFLEPNEIDAKLDSLTREGMVTEGHTITKKGRGSLNVVMCGGVFDMIHHGHIHTLTAAKSLGDVLVVVLASDATVKRTKRVMLHHGADMRRRIVSAVDVVDVCMIGHDADIFKSIGTVRPDTIALGYDQSHDKACIEDGCRKLGLNPKIVRLDSPVPNTTSSALKGTASLDVT